MSASHRTPPETNSFKNSKVTNKIWLSFMWQSGDKGHMKESIARLEAILEAKATLIGVGKLKNMYRDCDTCKIK